MTTSYATVDIPQPRPPIDDDGTLMRLHLVGGNARAVLHHGAREPRRIGGVLRKGAPTGMGDSVRFEHVNAGPTGWLRRLNGSIHEDRVTWEHVATYLPMELIT